jgi:hypothetical protein
VFGVFDKTVSDAERRSDSNAGVIEEMQEVFSGSGPTAASSCAGWSNGRVLVWIADQVRDWDTRVSSSGAKKREVDTGSSGAAGDVCESKGVSSFVLDRFVSECPPAIVGDRLKDLLLRLKIRVNSWRVW